MKKGITKSVKGLNLTLSGKQKKVPGAQPAPKSKPRGRGNRFAAKKRA